MVLTLLRSWAEEHASKQLENTTSTLNAAMVVMKKYNAGTISAREARQVELIAKFNSQVDADGECKARECV
jgi:hypothetical protein